MALTHARTHKHSVVELLLPAEHFCKHRFTLWFLVGALPAKRIDGSPVADKVLWSGGMTDSDK